MAALQLELGGNEMKELDQKEIIMTREDFVVFVNKLALEFREEPDKWSNDNLASYMEAMAAWIEDMDGYYLGQGKTLPVLSDWTLLRDIFSAAKNYE
jgi:hypothetical protein